MKFVYSGKDVYSDSLKDRAEKKLSKLERYFSQEPEAIVRFKQQRGGRNIAEITMSVNGLILRSRCEVPQCPPPPAGRPTAQFNPHRDAWGQHRLPPGKGSLPPALFPPDYSCTSREPCTSDKQL